MLSVNMTALLVSNVGRGFCDLVSRENGFLTGIRRELGTVGGTPVVKNRAAKA